MERETRKLGIGAFNDASWGTHLCQFYKGKDDLVDILVPYFKAGLENNEFCMWVTFEPLKVNEAEQAMRAAIPDFNGYLERGQIEIIPHDQWYLKDGVFNLQRVLNDWIAKLNQALAQGYDGMRVTGNTAWLEKADWKDFTDYEAAIDQTIRGYHMIALCTYSLDRCNASEVIDVVSNHQYALIKRGGAWERIESVARRKAEEALQKSEEKYRFLYEESQSFNIVVGLDGTIKDANKAALKELGYSNEEVIGKPVINFVAEEQKEKIREIVEKSLAGEFAEGIDVPVYAKNGEQHTVMFSPGQSVLYEQGQPAGIIFTGLDITERKRAEQALAQTKESAERERLRLKTVLDTIPTGVIIIEGPDGRISYGNQRATELLGRKPEIGLDMAHRPAELRLFRPDLQPFPPEELPASRALLKGEVVRGTEVVVEHPNGQRVVILANAAPLRDEEGDIIGAISAFKDITERKHMEEELQKAYDALEARVQERTRELAIANEALQAEIAEHKQARNALTEQSRILEAFFKHTRTPLMFLDRNFNFIRVNEAYAKSCGRDVSEFPGHNHFEFYPSDAKEIFEQVVETQKPFETIARPFTFPDHPEWGETYWDWSLVPILDNKGEVEFLILSLANVTERKMAEDALRQASVYNRSLIEASLDPLVTIGPDGRITDVNRATETVTGRSRKQLIGTDFSDYFTEPKRAREGYRKVFEEGEVREYPLDIRHADGRVTPVLYNAAVYRDTRGTVIGVFAAARDITERKLAEAELVKTQKELADAKRLSDIGILAATVAHELRNPLGAIRLAAYNIRRKSPDHSLEKHLVNIEKKVAESDRIINNLLTYSRIKMPRYESVPIHSILEECISNARKGFHQYDVSIHKNLKSIENKFVEIDPFQITEVFNNILNNAYQAFPEKKGKIWVRADLDQKGTLTVSFRDNGTGIPKEDLEKVLQPFFTKKSKGTGLGLTICSELIQLHGGKTAIESTEGKGTTVTISLPVRRTKL